MPPRNVADTLFWGLILLKRNLAKESNYKLHLVGGAG